MRLGLLGPAEGDLAGLAHAAEFLLDHAGVSRVIYLGDDLALDDTVALWAESLVGGEPNEDAIWRRAAGLALNGSPVEIDQFVEGQRARMQLKRLETLPADGQRSVEMFGDRVAILIFDKANLDEDDIFSATFLVYGRSDEPLVKKIGTRWFVTPGRIGSATGGSLVLEDDGEEIVAQIYDAEGKLTLTEKLSLARTAKLKVTGDA